MSDFLFAEEAQVTTQPQLSEEVWQVLIVDDEKAIHQVTKLVLNGFRFEDQPVQFLHAYSGAEARQVLQQHPNIAVALVDVVMESNHAGLDLVRWIRTELNNYQVRLVLRTGQPGEAPEESVIRDYDINDYKNKTELTAIKLKTVMYSSLRSYRDIVIFEHSRRGLERIINASSQFLECDTLTEFGSAILSHVTKVMGLEANEIYFCAAVNDVSRHGTEFEILAVSGANPMPQRQTLALPNDVADFLTKAHDQKKSMRFDEHYVGYFPTKGGRETMLYVNKPGKLGPTDHQLLEFFSNNLALAYDNLKLRDIVRESQREISYILGEAVEKRSKETGSHVKRVANYSYILAKAYGLNEYHCQKIKLASPLHDVGKIGIPDAILNKPGKHDADEWTIMASHAQMGYDVLKQSQNEILQQGATIAYQHHEKWDGSGYPQRLKGEQIDISGRITALADVFDALACERCYKPAWPLDKTLELIKAERGKHFDPKLVDLFFANLDKLLAIRDAFPDQQSPLTTDNLESR